jgi:predicted house-cleaning NTP pyrophosphatase (Maf/HAM1 superfamily)
MKGQLVPRGGGPLPSPSAALHVVQKLPPEALVTVADIIRDVVRTSAALAEKHADFMHEMEHLRELGGHRERVLSALSQLLVSVDLNDEAKLRLVEGICQVALR